MFESAVVRPGPGRASPRREIAEAYVQVLAIDRLGQGTFQNRVRLAHGARRAARDDCHG